jgi:hypothetical protein
MWRRVERKFSISAPMMKVRPHHPWYLRWSMMMLYVLAAIGLAWWAFDSGLELAGFHRGKTEQELTRLREQVAKLTQENGRLTDQIAQFERQVQIEKASNQETVNQLKIMADENDRLQEDLVFFQDLTAADNKDGELGVHRLRLDRDTMPGEYHLRMLLVRGGQRAKQFNGSYQLIATIVENGQTLTQILPQDTAGNAQFQLNFRYYQRIEQHIQLSPEAQLENVQVRIFEKGVVEPKVRQTVSPS